MNEPAPRRRRARAARSAPVEQPMPSPAVTQLGDPGNQSGPVPITQFGAVPNSPHAQMTTGAGNSSGASHLAGASSSPPPASPVSDIEAARLRAAEIMDHGLAMDEGTDKFEFDRSIIPDGWDYAWKRLTTYGQEDPAYQVQLSRNGWEPVPSSRHPEMMPADWKHATITRDGQILMQRPMEITDRSRLIEKRRALDQVRVKEAQLHAPPAGTFERSQDTGPLVKVKKGYERIEIPKD